MRKIITLGIMLLFLGMTISSSTGINLEKQSIKPMSFGNILYVGGNGTGNYTSIQDAIDNASDGDTVYVYDDSSPYYEHLVINKSLKLNGENTASTRIIGLNHKIGIFIISDFVSVCNFTIQGNYSDHGIYIMDSEFCIIVNNIINLNHLGIVIDKSSFIQILNNRILNNTYDGICFLTMNNSIIDNNSIFDNGGDGIDIFDSSSHNTIRNNRIHWNRDNGIGCWDCENLTVCNNMICENNHNGIDCYSSNSINISDNTIWRNKGHGIEVWNSNSGDISGNRIVDNNWSGLLLFGVKSLNISWNNISGNKNSGIYSNADIGLTITMNKIEGNNEYGLHLFAGWDNNVSYNTIRNNGYIGCYLNISGNSRIICNTFINNHRNAFFGIRSDSIWDGNYWNRPRIFPKLIFGRIGLYMLIPWINIDWHPAQEPYDIEV